MSDRISMLRLRNIAIIKHFKLARMKRGGRAQPIKKCIVVVRRARN